VKKKLVVLSVLACWSIAICLAQRPGPATLESLLNSDEDHKHAAAATVTSPKGPVGTMARPKDGVRHPVLDKAWDNYDTAVGKVADEIRAAIRKQFDAVAAKGDLDAAIKWQSVLEKFNDAGEIPAGSEAKGAVNDAVAAYKKAREDVTKAYEDVVKALTMEKRLVEARAVRNESKVLTIEEVRDARLSTSPPEKRETPAVAVRELTLKIHLTSDWGSVVCHPASSVKIIEQEVVRGGRRWNVNGNMINCEGRALPHIDSAVQVTCRLDESAKEVTLETHKGDVGALHIEVVSRGEVLGKFVNEGSHGGNARRSESCRLDFKLVVP
jgi:hypothetical protein